MLLHVRKTFPRLSTEDAEELVQDAFIELGLYSAKRQVRCPPALGRRLAWCLARRAYYRSKHQACPRPVDHRDLLATCLPGQEGVWFGDHDLPKLLRMAAAETGGRQRKEVELATWDVVFDGVPTEEAANVRGVDRSRVSKCRAALGRLVRRELA
jgi:DNA-directed RNA polymerase specialized sigma24 family protein